MLIKHHSLYHNVLPVKLEQWISPSEVHIIYY